MRLPLALAALALAAALTPPATGACAPFSGTASLADLVQRIEEEGLRYVFVGERHGGVQAKRFAVELSNALLDRGNDVGLWVEGFRTGCDPLDATCSSVARRFNTEAFLALLDEARAPIHALDPPERDRRAARMAATIAAGRERVRVVLVGRSHVVDAGNPEAEHWVYGGGMRYPDPGDLVEAFPREESLTLTLEPGPTRGASYVLSADGCRTDYTVAAAAGVGGETEGPGAPSEPQDSTGLLSDG